MIQWIISSDERRELGRAAGQDAIMDSLVCSLEGINAGAIFFAEGDFARAICLVTSVDHQTVCARVVTIQLDLVFDAATGIGNCEEGDYPCRIVSTESIPEDVRNTLLEIDRKYRLRNTPEGSKLLSQEINTLLFFRFPRELSMVEKIQALGESQLDQRWSLLQEILLSRFQRRG